nr:hypothetical protein [Providencia sp. PROV195]
MKVWEEQIKNCIYHEVGHWIVAKCLDFETASISLELEIKDKVLQVKNARTHILYHPSLPSLSNVMKYILERSTVGLSGIMCQHILLNVDIKKAIEVFGSEDYEKAQELSLIYRGVKYPNDQSYTSENKQRGELILEAFTLSNEIINKKIDEIKIVSECIWHEINNAEGKFDFSSSQLDGWYAKKDWCV